jgi:hypothetical protein
MLNGRRRRRRRRRRRSVNYELERTRAQWISSTSL